MTQWLFNDETPSYQDRSVELVSGLKSITEMFMKINQHQLHHPFDRNHIEAHLELKTSIYNSLIIILEARTDKDLETLKKNIQILIDVSV